MTELLTGIAVSTGAALVNFAAGKIYNYYTGSSKNFFWREGKAKLGASQPLSFEDLKKRIRIAVIDDEDSFPIRLFQSEGYAIDKWDRVSDVGYGKLESGFYDIIVLDIKGIASDISEDDGLGVLESLKKHNPAQIIIAHSQHSYDLSKVRFWELADEKIAKPSDFLKIKAIIDNLIIHQFKPERYINALHALLQKNNINQRLVLKLDKEILDLAKTKSTATKKTFLAVLSENSQLLSQVVTISNTILKFFQ